MKRLKKPALFHDSGHFERFSLANAVWQDDLPTDLGSDEEEIAAILSLWEPPIPAVYSPFAVETADYPVPSDLRGP